MQNDLYCMGFQSGGLQTKDGKDMVLLGGMRCFQLVLSIAFVQLLHLMFVNLLSDIAFSNKLVLYDLENQVIGWTDYNCKFLLLFP